MSRIGRLPIAVPSGVQIKIDGHHVSVKGQRGELAREFHPDIEIKLDDGKVIVTRPSDSPHASRVARHRRARCWRTWFTGVSQGFRKTLQIEGVGYRATLEGANVVFYLGYSHPIKIEPPAGIKFVADEKAKTVTIEGNDREQVGQVAANLRKLRPPEPYKGKGVMYQGEQHPPQGWQGRQGSVIEMRIAYESRESTRQSTRATTSTCAGARDGHAGAPAPERVPQPAAHLRPR